MLFENVFFEPLIVTFAISFAFCTIVFAIYFMFSLNRGKFISKKRWLFPLVKASLVGGLTGAFVLTIVFTTLTPTQIVVEKGLTHHEKLSFFYNGQFLGVGGNYIVNNSLNTLQIIGISGDQDINNTINPGTAVFVRKCPEAFFVQVPEKPSKRIYYSRGRRRVSSGPTVYLIEKKEQYEK